LIAPEKTTKEEVLSFLGQPAERQVMENGDEVWIYYQVNKSLLRNTPYVGERIGTENYDVVTVTFMGDRVATCVYRMLSEEEFNKRTIPAR
jgi:hypothetical protein